MELLRFMMAFIQYIYVVDINGMPQDFRPYPMCASCNIEVARKFTNENSRATIMHCRDNKVAAYDEKHLYH
jgi:hypothetical protein